MTPLLAILILLLLLLTAVLVDMTLDNWGRVVTPGKRRRRPDRAIDLRRNGSDVFTTDARQRPAPPRRARPPRRTAAGDARRTG